MKNKVLYSALLGIALLAFSCQTTEKKNPDSGNTSVPGPSHSSSEPEFKKEGELDFISSENGSVLAHADIEIAASDGERQQGLMWRSKMDEDHGMLFIFDREEPQSFWMRNTILPLDIMFIGADSSINTIYKFTVPYSDQTLPAKENSMFVVEMNAGYCDRHKVKEGDKIRFTRNSPSL